MTSSKGVHFQPPQRGPFSPVVDSRKTDHSACAAGGQQRLDTLLREIDRLEVQIAELRQVHMALREVFATCKCAQPGIEESAPRS